MKTNGGNIPIWLCVFEDGKPRGSHHSDQRFGGEAVKSCVEVSRGLVRQCRRCPRFKMSGMWPVRTPGPYLPPSPLKPRNSLIQLNNECRNRPFLVQEQAFSEQNHPESCQNPTILAQVLLHRKSRKSPAGCRNHAQVLESVRRSPLIRLPPGPLKRVI